MKPLRMRGGHGPAVAAAFAGPAATNPHENGGSETEFANSDRFFIPLPRQGFRNGSPLLSELIGNAVRIRDSTCCCKSPPFRERSLSHSLPLVKYREGAVDGISQKTCLDERFTPAGFGSESHEIVFCVLFFCRFLHPSPLRRVSPQTESNGVVMSYGSVIGSARSAAWPSLPASCVCGSLLSDAAVFRRIEIPNQINLVL